MTTEIDKLLTKVNDQKMNMKHFNTHQRTYYIDSLVLDKFDFHKPIQSNKKLMKFFNKHPEHMIPLLFVKVKRRGTFVVSYKSILNNHHVTYSIISGDLMMIHVNQFDTNLLSLT